MHQVAALDEEGAQELVVELFCTPQVAEQCVEDGVVYGGRCLWWIDSRHRRCLTQDRREVVDADRLRQMSVHACHRTRVPVTVERAGGQRDDVRLQLLRQALLPDTARRRQPVEHRHLDIHQHDVVLMGGDGGHRRHAVTYDIDAMTELAQHELPGALIHRVVFSQQHAQRQPALVIAVLGGTDGHRRADAELADPSGTRLPSATAASLRPCLFRSATM